MADGRERGLVPKRSTEVGLEVRGGEGLATVRICLLQMPTRATGLANIRRAFFRRHRVGSRYRSAGTGERYGLQGKRLEPRF